MFYTITGNVNYTTNLNTVSKGTLMVLTKNAIPNTSGAIYYKDIYLNDFETHVMPQGESEMETETRFLDKVIELQNGLIKAADGKSLSKTHYEALRVFTNEALTTYHILVKSVSRATANKINNLVSDAFQALRNTHRMCLREIEIAVK